LVREIIKINPEIDRRFQDLTELNFYSELLKPTRIYFNVINQILSRNIEIKGMAHITGGGLPENLPRCMSNEFIPFIEKESWEIPYLFRFLQDMGEVPNNDLWNTFNLGVGFCLVVDRKHKKSILDISKGQNIQSWELGKIIRRDDANRNQILAGVSI